MRMQENNIINNTHQACSACKHQRKKCSDNCILAPYFPSNKSKEFQAVHKVFGVSNVTKMVKSCEEETERRQVVDSLIWEAFCRQRDPINGPLGAYTSVYNEYTKVFQELSMLKKKYQLIQMQNNQGLMSSKPISDSAGMDYHLHQNNGVIDSINGSVGAYKRVCNEYRKVIEEHSILKEKHQLIQMQNSQGLMSSKPISDSAGMDYHLHQNNGVIDSAAICNPYCSSYSPEFESLRAEVTIPMQQHSSQNLRQGMNSISGEWEQMEEGTRVGHRAL